MPEDTDQSTVIDPLTVGELISIAQAAEQSGFNVHFLRRLAENNRLKAKKIGHSWVTTLQAVEEYKRTRHRGRRTDLDKSIN